MKIYIYKVVGSRYLQESTLCIAINAIQTLKIYSKQEIFILALGNIERVAQQYYFTMWFQY